MDMQNVSSVEAVIDKKCEKSVRLVEVWCILYR